MARGLQSKESNDQSLAGSCGGQYPLPSCKSDLKFYFKAGFLFF